MVAGRLNQNRWKTEEGEEMARCLIVAELQNTEHVDVSMAGDVLPPINTPSHRVVMNCCFLLL